MRALLQMLLEPESENQKAERLRKQKEFEFWMITFLVTNFLSFLFGNLFYYLFFS